MLLAITLPFVPSVLNKLYMSDMHRDTGQGWGWRGMAGTIKVFSCSNALGQDVYGVLGKSNQSVFLGKVGLSENQIDNIFFTWPFIPLIFSLNCLINMDVLPRRFSLSLRK